MPEAFICDAVRTPFGRYGGSLATVRADDLGAVPIRALVDRNPGARIRFEVAARNRYFDLQPFLRRYRRFPVDAAT